MSSRSIRSLTGLALLATGCAVAQPRVWDKPGGTQDGFAVDRHACLKESTVTGQSSYYGRSGGYSSPTTSRDAELFNSCMNAHGWRLVASAAPGLPMPTVAPPPAVAPPSVVPAAAPAPADDPYAQIGRDLAKSALVSFQSMQHPTKLPYKATAEGIACMKALNTPEGIQAVDHEYIRRQSPTSLDRIIRNRFDPEVVAAYRVFFNEHVGGLIRSCMLAQGWQERKAP
jgi:hypothetical protein